MYRTFFDQSILEKIVTETNRDAANHMDSVKTTPNAGAKRWEDTHVEEMEKFFGLVMYMGLSIINTVW